MEASVQAAALTREQGIKTLEQKVENMYMKPMAGN